MFGISQVWAALVHAHTHASTTGQTTDDHHAKSHVHLADSSGTVAHSSTSGITATDHHAAAAAGPDADITVDVSGAAGTASTFARSGHGHKVATSATASVAVGTAAAGTSGHAPSRDDHVHPTGAGTPSTQAMGDAAATGSGPAAAMTDHKHAMPAFATNAVLLGSAAAAGAAATPMRSNDTIAAFDATSPSTQVLGDAAAVGVAAFAARRDHKHALTLSASAQSSPADPTGTTSLTGVMMGLAGSITPATTGRVMFVVSGTIANATAIADGANVQLRTGTGAAPANAAALAGTTRGGLVKYVAATTAQKSPFSVNAVVTGLAVGTAVWIDVGLAAVTGGTATVKDVSISAIEF